jgi:hypothetical protein
VSGDPIEALARQRLIKISAELEVELSDLRGGGPTREITRRLKARAAESLAALAIVDLFTDKGIDAAIALQNEVKRYDEWIGWMREILNEGITYDREQSEDEREALLDLLMQRGQRGEQEAIELGLIAPANDA